MPLITSRANPKIRLIRSLHDRKHRDRTRLFLIEGLRLVREAASVGGWLEQIVVAPELLGGAEREVLAHVGAPIFEVTPAVLASISPQHATDGVVAVARQRFAALHELRPGGEDCFVAMNRITQPWSIGNIVRTCDAVGAQGIILLGDSTDPYHPTTVRTSLGAVFSQRIVKASFEELTTWKEQHDCLLVGTSPVGDNDYREAEYRRPLVLLTGSERTGLRPEEKALCDVSVRIPMAGRCESHHVVVATALVLYEARNCCRAASPDAATARSGDRALQDGTPRDQQLTFTPE